MPDLPRIPVSWLWVAATAAATALIVAWLVAFRYPDLPDPMPVHWNAAGEADVFRPKSLSGFLGLILVGPGILLLSMVGAMALISAQSTSLTQRGGAKTPEAAQRAWHSLQATQNHLGWYLFGLNLLVLFLLVRSYGAQTGGADFVVFLLGVVVLTVFLVMAIYRAERVAQERWPRPAEEQRKWRGPLYHDPDDPRLLVPTDSGMNQAINLGRPAGRIIMGLLVLGPLLVLIPLLFL